MVLGLARLFAALNMLQTFEALAAPLPTLHARSVPHPTRREGRKSIKSLQACLIVSDTYAA